MGRIKIIDPGMMAFVEDLGRYGYQRYGVSVSGVMDEYAAWVANFLVGNEANAAVIEITLKGITLEFLEDTLFAITGSGCDYQLNGKPLGIWQSHHARAGDTLAGGFCAGGLRNYLSIAGGIAVPVIMGSRSTNLKGKFGGFKGRALQPGDILATSGANLGALPERGLKPEGIPQYGNEIDLRVVMGPQDDAFTEGGKETFLSAPYKVTFDSDRMGIRLSGEKVEHSKGADIISDGIAFGSVQIPGEGLPIVMMAERQTTGGYTKIATVVTADRSKLAQARPRSIIRFQGVTLEESLAALKEYRGCFERLDAYCPVLEKK
ncbi:MAG: biotin-dependent carboxyltransferase family protein [Treponema sp.]|jgi:biotin-dependent carboxylase-like uncharacterized protein|nr:biotin-dependent carboxyltransferase family protein [Treponema sp.]